MPIKLITHTLVSRPDSSGNRYSYTFFYTPATRHPFAWTSRGWGDETDNAKAFARDAGLNHEEVLQFTSEDIPIKQHSAGEPSGGLYMTQQIINAIKETTK